jgi:hypothetical protein
MSSDLRPYYVFTAVVLGLGAILSVYAESWTSFFVFSVLCAMAVWVAARASGPPSAPEAGEGQERGRPSKRRRQRGN